LGTGQQPHFVAEIAFDEAKDESVWCCRETSMKQQDESDEEALRRVLVGCDGVERGLLEGFPEMLKSRPSGTHGRALALVREHLLWRWAKRGQCGADGRLCIEKSLPDSIGCRVTHRGPETSERLGFVAACCSEFKELVKTLGVDEEPFYLVGDPNTKGSATAACFATV
jgi:hypothetical protein